MKIYSLIVKGLMIAILGSPLVVMTPPVEAAELPDFLYSKGGIIYPRTGDSSQEIFRTPSNVKDFIEPGMLIGVLPTDCIPASGGTIGSYYICHHNLYLKPEENAGQIVYRVIDVK
jgi:hypothetical protein